jgi:glycerol-3-phosphate dehydrogenase
MWMKDRHEMEQLLEDHYDLVVIGAGIYGAWAALHARLLGKKVLLVERGDLGSQTSSCSTKLLHGGLRYLENYEFSLVKKALKERAVLNKTFPHLFKPMEFVLPIRDGRPAQPWKLTLGLWFYDHMSFEDLPVPKSRRWSDREKSVYRTAYQVEDGDVLMSYGDGVTDDHRMCLEIVLEFLKQGGHYLSQTEAKLDSRASSGLKDALRTGLKGQRQVLLKSEDGNISKIWAGHLLHCTGRDIALGAELKKSAFVTKGVHLVLEKPAPFGKACLLHSPLDGRVFFAVPWYDRTLLGTTDTVEDASIAPRVENDDMDYLLKSFNHHLRAGVGRRDVVGSFAGYRVMAGRGSGEPSRQSREWSHEMLGDHQSFSLGGKFTSARVDALRMIENIFPKNPKSSQSMAFDESCSEEEIRLAGKKLFLSEHVVDHLWFRYGGRALDVLALIGKNKALVRPLVSDLPFVWAEVEYCCRHELVEHLVDVLRRRIPVMILSPYQAPLLRDVLRVCSGIKGWGKRRQGHELEEATQQWMEHSLQNIDSL